MSVVAWKIFTAEERYNGWASFRFRVINSLARTDLLIVELLEFLDSIGVQDYMKKLRQSDRRLDLYLDSMLIKFDGDVLITDPCYIVRADHHGITPLTKNDWDACRCGFRMEKLGIKHYLTRDTLCGDWGCTVFNTDTGEGIGKFCADAGPVSVFLLDEVLQYNPSYDGHIKRPWSATVIQDFSGVIQFVVEHETGVYDEDTEYWKRGEVWEDYGIHVVGHGVNKKTGEPINFRSIQTSL